MDPCCLVVYSEIRVIRQFAELAAAARGHAMWVFLGVIGGASYILGGLNVLTDENCNYVQFSYKPRVSSFACSAQPFDGSWGATSAGWLMIGVGLLLIAVPLLPYIRRAVLASRGSYATAHRKGFANVWDGEPRQHISGVGVSRSPFDEKEHDNDRKVNGSVPMSMTDGLYNPTVGAWMTDPTGRYPYRWHNGRWWTANVSENGLIFSDPVNDPYRPQ